MWKEKCGGVFGTGNGNKGFQVPSSHGYNLTLIKNPPLIRGTRFDHEFLAGLELPGKKYNGYPF
jgi:hypothetical protein